MHDASAVHWQAIVKEPVGVVLVVAPWNYPLLTSVNHVVRAPPSCVPQHVGGTATQPHQGEHAQSEPAVWSQIPAILSGNAVAIKHASRTPLCADHFVDAFKAAGAPDGAVCPTPSPCADLLVDAGLVVS